MANRASALQHSEDQDRILMPVTDDGKSHPDKAKLVRAGESDPSQPTQIGGRKVIHWIIKKNI